MITKHLLKHSKVYVSLVSSGLNYLEIEDSGCIWFSDFLDSSSINSDSFPIFWLNTKQ
jgi:hypothetical protein